MLELELELGKQLELEIEINGFYDKNSGKTLINGFINQKIPLYVKYILTELSTYLKEQKKIVETLRDDIIKKYGEEKENGDFFLGMYLNEVKDSNGNIIDATINEKYIEFEKEYNELLSTKKTIKYTPIDIDVLKKVETTENYPLLYLLINKEKND